MPTRADAANHAILIDPVLRHPRVMGFHACTMGRRGQPGRGNNTTEFQNRGPGCSAFTPASNSAGKAIHCKSARQLPLLVGMQNQA